MGSGVSSAQRATFRDQKWAFAHFGPTWHAFCPNRPGQLMAVGSADDNITLQPGVCDLASHVGVGASHNHPEKSIITIFSLNCIRNYSLVTYINQFIRSTSITWVRLKLGHQEQNTKFVDQRSLTCTWVYCIYSCPGWPASCGRSSRSYPPSSSWTWPAQNCSIGKYLRPSTHSKKGRGIIHTWNRLK